MNKVKFKSYQLIKSKSTIYGNMFIFILCLQFLLLNCLCSSLYNSDDENNVDNNLILNGLSEEKEKKLSFIEHIQNQTVVIGRDATFQCVIKNLNKNQVAWFHKDKHVILAVQDKVVNNRKGRIRVSNYAQSSFFLHIKEVSLEDQGEYMCQINSQPMLSQSAYLNVVVPPKFIEEKTSSDIEIKEGESVELRCTAESTPPPEIRWRREDNQQIQLRSDAGTNLKNVNVVYGSHLTISKATKLDMGAYICIANNSIPAAISKRVFLGVNFPPLIWTPKTKIHAYVGDEVTLSCQIESYPVALYYWSKSNQMIVASNLTGKYEIQYIKNTTVPYKGELRLKIRQLKPTDFTSYVCSVSNFMGKTMGTINLSMLERPSTPKPITPPSTTRYQPPPIRTKPPTRPFNENPIRPPLPGLLPDLNNEIITKPPRPYKPIIIKNGVKVPKDEDTIDQNNIDNDLIPWPINQSSSFNLSSNFKFIVILTIFTFFKKYIFI